MFILDRPHSSWEKNLMLLLHAFVHLPSLLPPSTPVPVLVFVGDGPARLELEAFCGQNGIDAVFMGHQTGSDLAECYASADLFAFPSFTETFGAFLLESSCHETASLSLTCPLVCASQVKSCSRRSPLGFLWPGSMPKERGISSPARLARYYLCLRAHVTGRWRSSRPARRSSSRRHATTPRFSPCCSSMSLVGVRWASVQAEGLRAGPGTRPWRCASRPTARQSHSPRPSRRRRSTHWQGRFGRGSDASSAAFAGARAGRSGAPLLATMLCCIGRTQAASQRPFCASRRLRRSSSPSVRLRLSQLSRTSDC